MTDLFTSVARRKIAELIRRDDFLKILTINNNSVYLEFDKLPSDEVGYITGCKIDSFGKVDWFNLND